MAEPSSFSKFVPGFDFLQGLVKNAGAAIPGLGQWVAPTLNPQELEKRIEELRTVQFWLEQNARMLGATIQALEVQRMTLSTLQAMNVPMADLKSALKAAPNPFAAPAAGDARNAGDDATADAPATSRAEPKSAAKPAEAATPAVDPMQWWSALTQQFTQLATTAMKDTATDAAKNLAGTMMKQSIEAASDTLRKAAAVPGAMVSGVAQAATAQRAKASSRAKAPAAAAAPAPAAKASRAAPRTTSRATTGAKRKT